MFKIDLSSALCSIVEAMLPERSSITEEMGVEHALYIRVQLGLCIFAEGAKDKTAYGYAHFVFSRPTNFTHVLMAVGGHALPPPETYVHQSYHDSCWRTDGFSGLHRTWEVLREELFHGTSGALEVFPCPACHGTLPAERICPVCHGTLPGDRISEFVDIRDIKRVRIRVERPHLGFVPRQGHLNRADHWKITELAELEA